MIRFGVLGAAHIAPSALIRPVRRNPGLAVVTGVAARDPERAAAFAAKHRIDGVQPTYEDLLADPDIDAVYNPLPNGLHGRWTRAALDAGKHVLCEKPLTANAEEARTVAAAAAARPDLVVMEALHYRYHPLATRLTAIVASGELGPVREIEVAFAAPLAKRGDIRFQADLAGGAMMDMGCYTVSLLRLLAQAEPTVVAARARTSSPGVDRAMRADLTLPEGGVARIHCSLLSASVLRLHARVRGEEGELHVFNPFAPQFGHRIRVVTASGRRVERVTLKPTYDFQLRAFAAAVNDGVPVLTPPGDAIANMAIVDDVYRAAGLEPRRPTG